MTSNKPKESRADYGLTIYNNSSPLNTSLVTSHAVTLSGLAQATLYHFRVRSRDAAGNLGISGNLTLTTLSAGAGIAALYPGDVGIEGDTHVVFVEKFDEASLTTM